MPTDPTTAPPPLCRAEYPRPAIVDPNTRIVRCNLPDSHGGDHDELVDGEPGHVVWSDPAPATVAPPPLYAVLAASSDAICVDPSAAAELADELSEDLEPTYRAYRLMPLDAAGESDRTDELDYWRNRAQQLKTELTVAREQQAEAEEALEASEAQDADASGQLRDARRQVEAWRGRTQWRDTVMRQVADTLTELAEESLRRHSASDDAPPPPAPVDRDTPALDLAEVEGRAATAYPQQLRAAGAMLPDAPITPTIRAAIEAAIRVAKDDVPVVVAELRRLRVELAGMAAAWAARGAELEQVASDRDHWSEATGQAAQRHLAEVDRLESVEQERNQLRTRVAELTTALEQEREADVEVLEDAMCRRVWAAALRWEADQLRQGAWPSQSYYASVLEIDAHRIEAGQLSPWTAEEAPVDRSHSAAAGPQAADPPSGTPAPAGDGHGLILGRALLGWDAGQPNLWMEHDAMWHSHIAAIARPRGYVVADGANQEVLLVSPAAGPILACAVRWHYEGGHSAPEDAVDALVRAVVAAVDAATGHQPDGPQCPNCAPGYNCAQGIYHPSDGGPATGQTGTAGGVSAGHDPGPDGGCRHYDQRCDVPNAMCVLDCTPKPEPPLERQAVTQHAPPWQQPAEPLRCATCHGPLVNRGTHYVHLADGYDDTHGLHPAELAEPAEPQPDRLETAHAPDRCPCRDGYDLGPCDHWMCRGCRNWFGGHGGVDGDIPPRCADCRKAGWVPPGPAGDGPGWNRDNIDAIIEGWNLRGVSDGSQETLTALLADRDRLAEHVERERARWGHYKRQYLGGLDIAQVLRAELAVTRSELQQAQDRVERDLLDIAAGIRDQAVQDRDRAQAEARTLAHTLKLAAGERDTARAELAEAESTRRWLADAYQKQLMEARQSHEALRIERGRTASAERLLVELRQRLAAAEADRFRDDHELCSRELAEARAEVTRFSAHLGFGDGVSAPATSLADMLDPIADALSAARDHHDCPVHCELCGETLAATLCQQCNGLGDIGHGAYSECPECAGVGRIHEGCAETSYADLVRERDAARADRDRFRGHSTTLNTIAWKIATALGDVPDGAEQIEGNPVEQAERLIRERDAARAEVDTAWAAAGDMAAIQEQAGHNRAALAELREQLRVADTETDRLAELLRQADDWTTDGQRHHCPSCPELPEASTGG